MRSSVIPRGRLKFFPTRRQLSNRYWGTISEPRGLSGRRKVEIASKNFVPDGQFVPNLRDMSCDMPRLPNQLELVWPRSCCGTRFWDRSHRERVQRAEGDNYANLDAACRCHPADRRGASFSPRGKRSGATAFACPVRAAAEYLGPKARRGGSCHRAGGDAQASGCSAVAEAAPHSGGGPLRARAYHSHP